jgi:ACS family glucarate transporter-like MFS transporter
LNSLAPTRIRWVLVTWIFLVASLSYLDRVNISIAGHSFAADFHLNDVQLGRIFSAFFLGYGLFQIAGGWAADRLGPRRVLTLGTMWWAAFTVLTASFPAGIAHAFLIIWAARFLLGVGESVMFPTSNRWVATWIPTDERGLANGLILAGTGAGSAFTPPIIRFVMVHLGWRAAFWVCALLGLLAGIGWYGMARDHPDQHPWLNDAERRLIHQGIPQADPIDAPKLSWGTMLGSKDVWALSLSYFCYGYTPAIFFTWFFIYLTRVRGLSLQTASYYSMLPFIAMTAGSIGGGWIADIVCRRFGRWWGRIGVSSIGMVGAGVFMAAGSHLSTGAATSVILAMGVGSIYLAQSAYFALSADFGKGSAGSLSGFMNMLCQMGAAITSMTTPAIAAHYGWTAAFLTSAVFCVLGGVLWLFINPDASLTPSEPAEIRG